VRCGCVIVYGCIVDCTEDIVGVCVNALSLRRISFNRQVAGYSSFVMNCRQISMSVLLICFVVASTGLLFAVSETHLVRSLIEL